jgi:hypothetical protein
LFALHLNSFRGHLKQNKFSFVKTKVELEKRLNNTKTELIPLLKKALKTQGVNFEHVIIAINKKDTNFLNEAINLIQKNMPAKTRTQIAEKSRIIGSLKTTVSIIHLERGFEIFRKVLPKIMKLRGKSSVEQRAIIEEIQRNFPHVEEYIKTFQKMGEKKALFYGDVANILKDIFTKHEKTSHSESSVTAKITYNLEEILSSDKFRNNCINPEKIGYHAVGFTIDPQEAVLGFYKNGYTGFSLIHIMKKGNERIIYVENPYTNNPELSSAMRTSAEGLVEKIIEEGQKRGLKKIKPQYAWSNNSKESLEAFPSINSNKYYDVFGRVVK